jgi:xylan 1,4-beta-xylosidase
VTRPAAFLARALVASLGVSGVAAAQADVPVTIEVDATAEGTPLEPIWAYFGYDEANYTNTPEGLELLRTLAAANRTAVRTRTHFLFNTGDGKPEPKWGSTNIYTEDANGNPVYDYTLIDQIMDATLDAGAFPLVELGFMPEALSTRPVPYRNSSTTTLDGGCFYPPDDYEKWGGLVTAWATHVKERYPDAAARFEWELWNEPDIFYWRGTFDEWARLYDYTEAALHAVLPDASLGGPAVASVGNRFLAQFLEHCTTGTNAVTGETGTRLDMVSFHAKAGVSSANGFVQMNLGSQLRLHRDGFATVAASAFARTPIVISEADPEGCAACPASQVPANAYRLSPAYGAYEVATMKRSLELAARANVSLRGILTWAFTFPGSPYFAGYRELSTNGIHLPVLNAFKLLGRLGGTRVPATSSGALPLDDILANGVRALPDVDGLATVEGDEIRILVWNYHDDLVDAPAAPVTLNIAVPASYRGNALVTHTRSDATHGDAVTTWREQGSPTAPTDEQRDALLGAMEPVRESERVLAVTSGSVRLSFALPRFGLSLVTLTPTDRPVDSKAPPSEPGCSCRSTAPSRAPLPVLLALALGAAFVRRRRSR